MTTESGKKYEYVSGDDGKDRIPDEMQGTLTEISPIDIEGNVAGYDLNLSTGVMISLPLVAEFLIRSLKPNDLLEIAPTIEYVNGKKKILPGQRSVKVTREGRIIQSFGVHDDSILIV